MSIEKIVAEAIENNPLKLKEAFEEEMNSRIRAALEEKYKKMMKKENGDEDEDEDDDDDEMEDDDDDDEEDMDEARNPGATPARYDMIKKAAQKVQGQEDDPRARRAAKRDMKARGAQRGMAPTKKDED